MRVKEKLGNFTVLRIEPLHSAHKTKNCIKGRAVE